MKKLQQKTIQTAVASWNIRFRANYKPEQLSFMAREYFEDLCEEQVTETQFEAAEKIVRRVVRFFPTMAEIMEAVREYRSTAPRLTRLQQIEDQSTYHDPLPEEIEINKKRIKAINDMLSGRLSLEDALKITGEKVDKFTTTTSMREAGLTR